MYLRAVSTFPDQGIERPPTHKKNRGSIKFKFTFDLAFPIVRPIYTHSVERGRDGLEGIFPPCRFKIVATPVNCSRKSVMSITRINPSYTFTENSVYLSRSRYSSIRKRRWTVCLTKSSRSSVRSSSLFEYTRVGRLFTYNFKTGERKLTK